MKVEELKSKYEIDKVLIDERTINKRVVELAEMINQDFFGKPIVLIGILKGSVTFMSELAKHITLDVRMDYIAASSYGDNTSSTRVKILKDLDEDVLDEHVLIVEDILDSGRTLAYLKDFLIDRGVASMSIIALLEKDIKRNPDLDVVPDYVGFKIPNEFVVGYGLDVGQYFRNLPYIASVRVKA